MKQIIFQEVTDSLRWNLLEIGWNELPLRLLVTRSKHLQVVLKGVVLEREWLFPEL